jgi:hypothetical protein
MPPSARKAQSQAKPESAAAELAAAELAASKASRTSRASTVSGGIAVDEAAGGAEERPAPAGPAAAGSATAQAPDLARTMGRAVTLPVRVAAAIADDVSSTARRPDAVLYWGGLAGLAVLGVLDWPVAAAVGIGVAVANGRRASRTARPAT